MEWLPSDLRGFLNLTDLANIKQAGALFHDHFLKKNNNKKN